MNDKSYLYLGPALLAVLMTVSCSKAPEEKSAPTTDQQVVASVNGVSISRHQLDRFIKTMNQGRPPGPEADSPENSPKIEKDALMKLIQVELL